MLETSRRSLITGLVSLLAAPAIVRVGSLMSVRVMKEDLLVQELSKRRGPLDEYILDTLYETGRDEVSMLLFGALYGGRELHYA
jgi:hypothetical protein